MFRESDEVERKVHRTYTTKPVPVFQQASIASKLDDSGVASHDFIRREYDTPEVPTTWGFVYDPSHPDADWSGIVDTSKHHHKKHVNNHISHKDHLVPTEGGFVGSDEKQSFLKRRPDMTQNRSNSSIIGGIDFKNDNERWMSTTRRQLSGVPTEKEQLTLEKRVAPRKHLPDPAQVRGRGHGSSNNGMSLSKYLEQSNPYNSTSSSPYSSSNPNGGASVDSQGSMLGKENAFASINQKANAMNATNFKKSFISSDLADSLLSQIDSTKPQEGKKETPESFYSKSQKLLYVDNFRPYPGKVLL